ncbi:MAG: sulfatase [Actinomycetales bacterium]|nr:sulfatase [Actinomycetales bacterium]
MLTPLPDKARRVLVGASAVTTVIATLCLAALLPGIFAATRAAEASAAPAQSSSADPDPAQTPAETSPAGPRNVVLLLADDLDWPLFEATPELQGLRAQGTTLSNFVVTDSLCCPSRTSLLRSQYVHNHRVKSNVPRTKGGWETFYRLNRQRSCLPTWLSASGISTALVGKYLNGFPGDQPSTYVPPGWDHFVTTVNGAIAYKGYGYELSTNGQLTRPPDFLNDRLTADALDWISRTHGPFYLQFSSFLPHTPSPASPADVGHNAGAKAPRPPSFNALNRNDVPWLSRLPAIKPARQAVLDRAWARRMDSARSFARSVTAIIDALRQKGVLDSTLVVIASDNGYHVGTHRMETGKQSPFREDTVVPAVVIGSGAQPGTTIDAMTSMIDLAPTFAAWLGASVPSYADGRDLLPLIGNPGMPWRTGVLTEHFNGAEPGDPDYSEAEAPPYRTLRTKDWLLVHYQQADALYNLREDPYEMTNVYDATPQRTVRMLQRQLRALTDCAGATCRVADSMPVPPAPGPSVPAPTPAPSVDAVPGMSPSPSSTGSSSQPSASQAPGPSG